MSIAAPTIVIATWNEHKVEEIAAMLQAWRWPGTVLSLKTLGMPLRWEESGTTFSENARIKWEAVRDATDLHVLADDSGLVVPALGGAPGIYSCRFAGANATDADNRRKLLLELAAQTDRRAFFTCTLCFGRAGESPHFFEGQCHGRILTEERGSEGFGYDSLFVPTDHSQTFAEIPLREKNTMSHRAQALRALFEYLS